MNRMSARISVVILNWNTKDLLEKFLPFVLATNHPDFEVVLADNASTDGSVAMVQEKFPTVKIVETGENLGYPGGYNNALRDNKSEYYVLLNSDVEVHPDWLKELDAAATRNNWAAAQPKILDYNNRDTFEYAGACGGFIDYLGYPFCRGRILDSCEKDTAQYDEEIEIHWASGAALFIKSEIYWSMGGLDESFFAHMEEIDLCWRIKNQGYKIGVAPMSKVFHIGGGTLSKQSSKKTFLNFRNGLVLLIKNLPTSQLIWKIPYRLVLDGVAGVFFLFQGNWKDTIAVIKAHFSVYSRIRFWWSRRKKIAPKKERITLYPKLLVSQFYLKGKKKYSEL